MVTGPTSTWTLPLTDASRSRAFAVKAPLPAGKAIRKRWPGCEGVEVVQREGEEGREQEVLEKRRKEELDSWTSRCFQIAGQPL